MAIFYCSFFAEYNYVYDTFIRFLKDFLRLAYEGEAQHLSRFAMAKLPRRHKTCMRHIFRHTIYTLHKHGFFGYRIQSES